MNSADMVRGRFYRLTDTNTAKYGRTVSVGDKLVARADGVDEDEDAQCYKFGEREGTWFYVNINHVEPWTDEEVKEEEPQPSFEEIWEVGNVVEFDADGVIRGNTLEVGCKSINLSEGLIDGVIQAVKNRTLDSLGRGVTVTIRGAVSANPSSWLLPRMEYTPPTGRTITVSRDEAFFNCRNHKLVQRVAQRKPDVTITMTHEEADAFMAISGAVGGSQKGPRGKIESLSKKVGEASGIDDFEAADAWKYMREGNSIWFEQSADRTN